MKRVDQWEIVAAVAMRCPLIARDPGKVRAMSPFGVAQRLDKLARIARTLHRYYEWQCNDDTSAHTCLDCGGTRKGPHTYANCAGAKVYALQERAEKLGVELGIVVENQTDPRGAPIKLWADKVDGHSLGCIGVS